MVYNLHPLFVHFPIALLSLYSLIKIFPLDRWWPRIFWSDVSKVLILVGVLGAFASLSTGEMAEHFAKPDETLVKWHSSFAVVSTMLYLLLLLGELSNFLYITYPTFFQRDTKAGKMVLFIERIFRERIIVATLSLLALASIILTGMFGGAMVYGTTADPFTKIIFSLLKIN